MKQYMMKRQKLSYQNTESGEVIDPLTIQPSARSNARSKRADESSKSKKRRQSFFNESSTHVDVEDLQYEPVISSKGRPSKK
jgi:hypothetical protein